MVQKLVTFIPHGQLQKMTCEELSLATEVHPFDLTNQLNSSFPKWNFGRNQRPDSSVGPSLLFRSTANDLYFNISTNSHRNSLRLWPFQAQFTIFRVLTLVLLLQPLSKSRSVASALEVVFFSNCRAISWSTDTLGRNRKVTHNQWHCTFTFGT